MDHADLFSVAAGVGAAWAYSRRKPSASLGEALLFGVGVGSTVRGGIAVGRAVSEAHRRRTNPRVLISHHHAADGSYRDLLADAGSTGDAGFRFEDHSVTSRIRSRRSDRIRADLTRRVRGVDRLIVVIGAETHRRPYVRHEIRVALEAGIPVIAVKLHRSFIAPPELYRAGVTWLSASDIGKLGRVLHG